MAKSKHSRSKATLFFSLLIFLSLLLVLTLLGVGFIFVPSDNDNPHRSIRFASNHDEAEEDLERWTEVISWEPRAVIYHNFLTKAECEHLINISRPLLRRSYVVNTKTGEAIASSARTSYGMFLRRGQDAIISSIEKRIADFTFIPVENGEGIQILRYEEGQEYMPHSDYFLDGFSVKRGGQRIATVLMYLSNVEEGGETVFPSAKTNSSTVSQINEESDCAETGLAVKPRMGDALLFWSLKPNGTIDSKSIHGGCPVTNGTKWSATKWLHVMEFK